MNQREQELYEEINADFNASKNKKQYLHQDALELLDEVGTFVVEDEDDGK